MRVEAGRSCDRQIKCKFWSMLTVFWYLAPLFKGEIRDTWKLVFTHVIREICQNLYSKWNHESLLLPSKSGLSTQFIEQDLVVLLQLHNCWFSHDVTKIQTTKLSILLSILLSSWKLIFKQIIIIIIIMIIITIIIIIIILI